MADEVDELRKEIVVLPTEQKKAIAKDVVRMLDPMNRQEVVSEFREPYTQEEREHSQRRLVILVGFVIIIGCLALLVFTLLQAQDQLDKVIGLITTIIGTAAGFIGGRGIRGQEPEG